MTTEITDRGRIAQERAAARAVLESQGQSILAQAMQYYGDLVNAQASGRTDAANTAIAAIRSLASPTAAVAGIVNGLLASVNLKEAVVELDETDNMVEKPTSSRNYSGVRNTDPRVQEYFNRKLGGANYASAEADIQNGRVVGLRRGSGMGGEDLRAAFNDLSLVGMRDDEQKKSESEGQPPAQPLTQADGQRISQSLDRVERFRLGEIANDNSLSDDEKNRRAQAVHDKFDKARGKLQTAMEIERRIDAAPNPPMREAARQGAQPQREAARRDLGRAVREDVIEGGLMEEKPETLAQRTAPPVAPTRQPMQVATRGSEGIPTTQGRTGGGIPTVTRGGGGMSM